MTADTAFPTLFSPLRVGPIVLKNRIFSTGHMTVMLEDGVPSARMAAYHGARAEGGAGLIIVEAARAHPSGTSGRAAITAYDDACIPGYERIIAACRPPPCRWNSRRSYGTVDGSKGSPQPTMIAVSVSAAEMS